MPVDSQTFKDVMAHWGSGVTIVTTAHEGSWKGTTASSLSSVSLNPPMISVCLAQKLYTHQLVKTNGVFAVNILAAHQLEIGKLFAGMYPEIEDRFAQNSWETAVSGSPVLQDALGWVDCKIAHAYPAGDHTIFVGNVLAGNSTQMDTPLLYFNREWGQFAQLSAEVK